MKKIKEQIFKHIDDLIESRKKEAILELESLSVSKNSETKSSAGDKHETGRAMMQIEMEHQEQQLNKLVSMQNELSQINIEKEFNKVEPGSLVLTNHENYFFSLGIGKVVVNNEIYYALSISSPIGQLLQNKIAGNKIHLNGRELTIIKIF